MSSTFAERLKELRKKAGITQEQLAEIIGIHEAPLYAGGNFHNASREWMR